MNPAVVAGLALTAGIVTWVKTRRSELAPVMGAAVTFAVVVGAWATGLINPTF